jgi:hypothetical protein
MDSILAVLPEADPIVKLLGLPKLLNKEVEDPLVAAARVFESRAWAGAELSESWVADRCDGANAPLLAAAEEDEEEEPVVVVAAAARMVRSRAWAGVTTEWTESWVADTELSESWVAERRGGADAPLLVVAAEEEEEPLAVVVAARVVRSRASAGVAELSESWVAPPSTLPSA